MAITFTPAMTMSHTNECMSSSNVVMNTGMKLKLIKLTVRQTQIENEAEN